MSSEFFISSTVAFVILSTFIGGAVNGGELPSVTHLLNLFSPILGPLSGWLLISLPQRRKAEAKRLAELPLVEQRVRTLVELHRPALARNLMMALKIDDYGTVRQDTRHGVWRDFFLSVGLDAERFPEMYTCATAVLDEIEAAERTSGFDIYALPANGHDFEEWVAAGLARYGWKARTTAGSGDQGIDIIAERNGRKLGIQCKLYSGNIGNKAVQEAHAGKAYYCLDDAAVLTNSKFTPSARNLAASTGTHLLSQFDIPTLHQTLKGYEP